MIETKYVALSNNSRWAIDSLAIYMMIRHVYIFPQIASDTYFQEQREPRNEASLIQSLNYKFPRHNRIVRRN